MAVVLVTDGDQRAALATVRSLGRAGHAPLVLSETGRSLAGASRFAAREVRAPAPLTDPAGFAAAVRGLVREAGVEVVLPIAEPSVLALLPAREALAPAALPFPSLEAFRTASDKAWAATAAESVGIAAPERRVLSGPGDAAALPRHAPHPRVLKPARSVQGGRKLSVGYVAAGDDLHAAVAALPPEAFPLLVQERVEGPGTGVFLLRWDGRTHAAFAHRRLREKPPSGGVSVLREGTALDADLRGRCEALLDRLDWRGVAMLELKVSVDDGRPYLMEINGRLWGSLQLALDSGVDFPARLVALALGRDPGPAPPWRTGVRTRWTLGDLDHLLLRLRRDPRALGLPPDAPGRAAASLAFLRGFLPPVRSEVFRWSDPYPFARETRAWVRALRRPSTSP